MKPDEDYEDLDEVKQGGNARAMSWMVLAVAVGGFAALAFYAYNSGKPSAGESGDTVTIAADPAPIKEAPATPDGEEFPNQDKTIYDVIANDGSKPAEKLMPEPERPVTAAGVEDEDSIAAAAPDAPAVTAPAAAPATPVTTAAAPAEAPAKPTAAPTAPATTTFVATPEGVKPVEEVPAKAEEKSYANPQIVNEKPAVKAEAAKADPKKEVKAEEKKAAAKSVAGGAYKVQLGAYKSEDEAQAAWKKIKAKHGDVLGAPVIIKAELEKGTFYRLRAGSYATAADAKSVCAKLSGQACIPAK